MRAKVSAKFISILLILSLACPGVQVYADEIDYAVSEEAANNVKIISELYQEADQGTDSAVDFGYDARGRIVKLIARTGTVQETTEITYNEDNTYTKTKSVSTVGLEDVQQPEPAPAPQADVQEPVPAGTVLRVETVTVSKDEGNDLDVLQYAVSDVAATNVKIFNALYQEADQDAGCAMDFEYDDLGRFVKITARTGSVQEVTEITYNEDNTYTKTKTVSIVDPQQVNPHDAQDAVMPLSGENYDDLLKDSSVKNRISEAQDIYNNGAASMRNRAHLEAQMARADYCVIYPKSSFAKSFLESGSLSTGLGFRRVLRYKNPQMYGMDVMAVQRALMSYGYLDTEDVADEQLGYFGPTTEAAVKDYQLEKFGAGDVDGSVGKQTLTSLFSAGSVNNTSQASLNGLNRINVYRTKHNAVCNAVIAKVNQEGAKIYTEAYIYDAGLKGNGGRADVVRVIEDEKLVWEIKPDSAYGRATGKPQVKTYVNCSKSDKNKAKYKDYCPLGYGYDISTINVPWKGGTEVYASSVCDDGYRADGVVFYRDRKNKQPVFQPAFNPVHASKPNEDYQKISLPDPDTLYNGLVAIGVTIAAVYIIKTAFALAAAVPSGGTSLLLLCF